VGSQPLYGVEVTGAAVTANPLLKGRSAHEAVTCTNANTDYPASGAMPAGTTYVTVYCSAECAVAMGEATTNGIGYWQGAGASITYPTKASGVGADDTAHVRSTSAAAVVHLTYGRD
jgi:hypothetical protein